MLKLLLYVVSDSHLPFNTLLDACQSLKGISWIGWKECYLSTSCWESWYCPGRHALWLCASHVRSFNIYPWYLDVFLWTCIFIHEFHADWVLNVDSLKLCISLKLERAAEPLNGFSKNVFIPQCAYIIVECWVAILLILLSLNWHIFEHIPCAEIIYLEMWEKVVFNLTYRTQWMIGLFYSHWVGNQTCTLDSFLQCFCENEAM